MGLLYPRPRVFNRWQPNTNGLIAWFPFDDGSAYDASGYGNTGTLTGSPKSTYGIVPNADGRRGALNFNGTTSYVSVASNSTLNSATSQITVACWVNFNNASGQQRLVSKWNGTQWELQNDGGAGPNFGFELKASSGSQVHSNTAIVAGRWYHVAGVYDGAHLQIFVSGKNDGSSVISLTGTITTNTAALGIGADGNGGTKSNAKIDDVRIYSRALSPGEIYELYASGLLPPEENEMPAMFAAPLPPPWLPMTADQQPDFRVVNVSY